VSGGFYGEIELIGPIHTATRTLATILRVKILMSWEMCFSTFPHRARAWPALAATGTEILMVVIVSSTTRLSCAGTDRVPALRSSTASRASRCTTTCSSALAARDRQGRIGDACALGLGSCKYR
jgi:hypothetical protein